MNVIAILVEGGINIVIVVVGRVGVARCEREEGRGGRWNRTHTGKGKGGRRKEGRRRETDGGGRGNRHGRE